MIGEETQRERAIAYIRDRGTARTPEIENALGIVSAAAILKPAVDDGTLVVCKADRPGLRSCNEYRLSVAGGGRTTEFRDMARRPAPPVAAAPQAPAKRRDAAVPPAPAAAPEPLSPRIGAIEKGIPFPTSKRGTGELRVQISQLEVGDSFVTSYSDSACYSMARKLGMKVISRPEGEAGDIRVWRTA